MKTLILGFMATSFAALTVQAADTKIHPTFCGFFLDKKPLTVQINGDRTAVLAYEGKTYALAVETRVDGIPHGYACDDSVLCVTGIEYTLTGPGASFTIYDSFAGQKAEAYGKNENIFNFHTLNGVCE